MKENKQYSSSLVGIKRIREKKHILEGLHKPSYKQNSPKLTFIDFLEMQVKKVDCKNQNCKLLLKMAATQWKTGAANTKLNCLMSYMGNRTQKINGGAHVS